MADIYWLRTVQYYGSERLFSQGKGYTLLRPLIDITTALDPRLELAYRYGAVFLSEDWPVGAGNPKQGIEVLESGVAALPGSWRLRWDLGSSWFFFMKNPRKAAEVLVQAESLPGAPYWLASLAAKFLEGDDRASAREIWRRQHESGDGSMRDNALYHLQTLDALDARDALNAASARFHDERGRFAASLEELADRGFIRRVPTDPTGVPFQYNPEDGQVAISRESRLWRSKYE
jgi:hypothetical protein